eukprot:g7345.t1
MTVVQMGLKRSSKDFRIFMEMKKWCVLLTQITRSQTESSLKVLLARQKMKDGLGSAYRDGVKLARGKFIVLMDADMSHNPEDLVKFIKKQEEEQADIVTGSRYTKSGGIGGWNFRRRLISRGANTTARALLAAKASDLTGSYRLYKSAVLKDLLAETHSNVSAFL